MVPPALQTSLAVEREESEEDTTRRLKAAVATLDARSRDILMRRFLAEQKATLHELAAEYKVSAERVRQIEANALKKLRHALGEDVW